MGRLLIFMRKVGIIYLLMFKQNQFTQLFAHIRTTDHKRFLFRQMMHTNCAVTVGNALNQIEDMIVVHSAIKHVLLQGGKTFTAHC